ncbi:GntR family transcriptional regulator [Streptomyces abyssalis]|uniref:GntR family transcriptional regulator n=1 Tax=Streptomyces abyssalis TaxID=933944 RepID=A0A1E7JNQ2_9ACTN|nr:GntR family transcriptional regulator [Streptomyces abyssalis]OEU86696.1 GntR family transcriptional regulator [Streptomyces abyssalis]OEU89917.1 GntR family transcriptional regulator [Streptomyces abyssalis]OEV04437.1 GntR family transcriptional regulator [Streptomyces nanshensis]
MVVKEIEFRIDRRSGIAAYQQIVLQTKQALRLGVLLPGDRLPTAKEVAESSAVNPNTTLKAYRELEREGLVEPRPGVGTFVRQSLAQPQAAADSPLRRELAAWMDRARAAGLESDDVTALVASVLEERYAESPATTRSSHTGSSRTGSSHSGESEELK